MVTKDKPICIVDGKRYYIETIETTVDGKPFTIDNLYPVFRSEAEREEAKRKIASELYKVFAKYFT